MATTQTPQRSGARLPGYAPEPGAHRRDWLRALGAGLAIAVLVIGVPVGLLLGLGFPVPHSAPSKDWLTGELTVEQLLRVLSLVVWLAWAHFVVCLLVEWRAERRGAGLASGVPLGGGSQALARRLVASVLLLAGAATVAAPFASVAERPAAVASATAGASASTASTPRASAESVRLAAASSVAYVATVDHAAGRATKYYEVRGEAGRHHDSLWGIAERHLGSGLRYKEIFALNKDRLQPDGSRITKAELIRPGWVLRLPGDATGDGLRVVEPPPVHRAPVSIETLAGLAATQDAQHASVSSPVSGNTVSDGSAAASEDGGRDVAGHAALGASLMAAGLLVGLRRRRGPFGAPAEGEDLEAELGLRLAADLPTAQFVDAALRSLAATLTAAQRPLPEVYCAMVDDDALVLRLAPADPDAPAPWTADAGGKTWTLDRATFVPAPEAVSGPAPFPGLVAAGTFNGWRVLVDLAAARGIVSIGGDLSVARDIAASFAVELATALWTDDVRVTMVGFGDELHGLAPARLRHVDALEDALRDLELRGSRGADAVLQGSARRTADAARPEFLVLSHAPSEDDEPRLAALAGARTSGGGRFGVVTVGDVPTGRWRFVAQPDGLLDTGVLGMDVAAHRLPSELYRPLVSLFAGTGAASDRGEDAEQAARGELGRVRSLADSRPPEDPADALEPDWRPEPPAPAAADPDRQFAVEVAVLGPFEVSAPGALDPARTAVATEVVIHLALHRGGVHPHVLRAAVWPRGASDAVVDAALAHVQEWLGRGADGLHRMRLDEGRWRLGDDVGLDWDRFRGLAARAESALDAEEDLLGRALGLVRGEFTPLGAGRYAWLARQGLERDLHAGVAACAHRAAELALGRGDAAAAEAHARSGLRMLPTSELLWRDVLRARALTGARPQLEEAAEELSRRLGSTLLREVSAAQTDALLAELLPGWRPSAA